MSTLNASYTMSHLEFRTLVADWFSHLFDPFAGDDEDIKTAMYDVFNGRYDMYEISGETIGEQKLFLQATFNQHYRYYKEILDNYMKQWDYSTGGRKITSFERSGSNDTNGISVELPNKVVDEDDIYKYPDSGDKGHSENESSGTSTVYDTSAFISLKREYIDQIRNVFEEFANRFDDCFMMLY